MQATLIGRYILKSLAGATLVATLIVSLVIWLIQSLKFFELAVNGGAPLSLFLSLVMLTMPGIVAVVLPIILFVAVAFVYNKLTVESELIVLRALGLSQWRLAQPALLLGAVVALIVFVLNAFIAPVANERLKTLQDMTRAQYVGVLLNDGVFNSLGDHLTIYVRERAANGDLRGLLIYEEQDKGRPITFVAKRGVLVDGDQGPEMVVYDGIRQEVDPATGKVQRFEFALYRIDLQQVQDTLTARWKEPSERTLPQLLAGVQSAADKAYEKVFLAEAHNRMASPVVSLALTMIGIAALLGGRFDRRGQVRRILIGFGAILAVEIIEIGFANLARLYGQAIPLLYVAGFLPLGAAALQFARANDGSPPWKRWLTQFRPSSMMESRPA